MTATIIDFHLVEKCRTKFRAHVKSFGAKVKFEPVADATRKQEYHGTVTVTRACKQQFLTQNSQVIATLRAKQQGADDGDLPHLSQRMDLQLQCAAPIPITTGARLAAHRSSC